MSPRRSRPTEDSFGGGAKRSRTITETEEAAETQPESLILRLRPPDEVFRVQPQGVLQESSTYTDQPVGQYRFTPSERIRVSNQFNTRVIGRRVDDGFVTEGEHPVADRTLRLTTGAKRGETFRVRKLEGDAPSYLEDRAFHRLHIGTNRYPSRRRTWDSGYSREEYDQNMRGFVEDSDLSSAVQYNQLDYAFNPAFQASASQIEGQITTNSFDHMALNARTFRYAMNGEDVTFEVTKGVRLEMAASRRLAQTGRWDQEMIQRLQDLNIDMDSTNPFTIEEKDAIFRALQNSAQEERAAEEAEEEEIEEVLEFLL